MRILALERIAAERLRQIEVEGYSTENDDFYSDGSLADAAACYALTEGYLRRVMRIQCDTTEDDRTVGVSHLTYRAVPAPWPRSWHCMNYKPKNRLRDLVRAGALIVAEIERLQRIEMKAIETLQRLENRA